MFLVEQPGRKTIMDDINAAMVHFNELFGLLPYVSEQSRNGMECVSTGKLLVFVKALLPLSYSFFESSRFSELAAFVLLSIPITAITKIDLKVQTNSTRTQHF